MTTATVVKERPILFSGPMVRALLAGTKTQTRRIVKPQPSSDRPIIAIADNGVWRCPYGQLGDRLWVRETCFDNDNGGEWIYRADGDFAEQFEMVDGDPKWTPSIHCPRRASRILLEITDMRVERLRDITSCDAAAEGIEVNVDDIIGPGRIAMTAVRRINAYRRLWDEINGKGAWRANPWVWCLSFRRVATLDVAGVQPAVR